MMARKPFHRFCGSSFSRQLVFIFLLLHSIGVWASSPQCPCLRSPSKIPWRVDTRSGAFCDKGDALFELSWGTHCYPSQYGFNYCRAWDSGLRPSCLLPRGLCEQRWCFVDPANCSLVAQSHEGIPQMHISYATCAAVSGHRTPSTRSRRELRVGIDSWSVMSYRGPDGQWLGYVYEAWKNIAATTGTALIEVPERSTAARNFSNNAFTQCAFDVALGVIDTCIPAMWETMERRDFVDFLTPYRIDQLAMAIRREKVDLWKAMPAIFEPFSLDLWIAIAITLVFVGIVTYMFEKDLNESDFPGGDFFFCSRQVTMRRSFHRLFRGVTQGVYQTVLSFVSAAPIGQPITLPGSIMNVAFGFFCLITIAAYTANLAATLTGGQLRKVSSVDDLIRGKWKVCVLDAVDEYVKSDHPELWNWNLLVTCGTGTERSPISCRDSWTDESLLKALDNGDCKAVINSRQSLEMALARQEDCKKYLILPQTVSTVLESCPARPSQESAVFSRALTNMRMKGELLNIERKYVQRSPCVEEWSENIMGKFNSLSMLGAFCNVAVAVAIACIVKVIEAVIGKPLSGAAKERTKELKRADSDSNLDDRFTSFENRLESIVETKLGQALSKARMHSEESERDGKLISHCM